MGFRQNSKIVHLQLKLFTPTISEHVFLFSEVTPS